MSASPTSTLGTGLVGQYRVRRDGTLEFEGPRPGPGWHRHDWQRRTLVVVRSDGVYTPTVVRRRWRLGRTSQTHLDRAPDELPAVHAALVYVLAKLHAWLGSGVGLHSYAEAPAMRAHGSKRTVQRWLARVQASGMRLQQALRTAVIERLEPQPVEVLFPGGLSPPGAVRCRRWKDPAPVYSLATALAQLGARVMECVYVVADLFHVG